MRAARQRILKVEYEFTSQSLAGVAMLWQPGLRQCPAARQRILKVEYEFPSQSLAGVAMLWQPGLRRCVRGAAADTEGGVRVPVARRGVARGTRACCNVVAPGAEAVCARRGSGY